MTLLIASFDALHVFEKTHENVPVQKKKRVPEYPILAYFFTVTLFHSSKIQFQSALQGVFFFNVEYIMFYSKTTYLSTPVL